MKQDLDEIKEHLHSIKLDISEIKVDVRHHIKRSDKLEDIVSVLVKFKDKAVGALSLIAFVSALVTIYEIFK